MADTLFEYAIIRQAKKDKDGEVTQKAELLQPPTHVLAKNEAQAATVAARAIPDEEMENLDRIDVVVRPF